MLLKLENINKVFKIEKGVEFYALNDVNISFEKGEFVSIVGPSGSGKSTLLNIIAGLDVPSSGKLVIGNVSSKEFKKKDWDLYRKNNIGFVFQNFNLIEHLTALENVEIVMNLIGLSLNERRTRAKELLKKVGLENHSNHKPSELSGGQKQRVAIARALANDPDIILADEPTGALDKNTGKQIMELLKSIASDKLIIMVTHNDKLANEYSSRIIKVRDGQIESDTNLLEVSTNKDKSTLSKKDKSMSFYEAFKLSLRNMSKKKWRVAITTIAGCIGIAGFALIMGLGNGANIYIDKQLNKFGSANVLVVQKNVKSKDSGVVTSTNINDYTNIFNSEEIKEKISKTRSHMGLSNAVIKINNAESDSSISSLADEKNTDFLIENIDGKLPAIDKNEVLVNQALARSILEKNDISSKDTKLAIGKTVNIILNYTSSTGETLDINKEFIVSGIINELDLSMANLYYNYDYVVSWLKGVNLENKTAYDYFTQNKGGYELILSNVKDNKEVADYINNKENGGSGTKVSFDSQGGNEKNGYSAKNMAISLKTIFAQLILMAQIVISIFIIVALIVSSIMTAIVLYSSIVERKTEIGIIKAVGGRNKDVIRIFECEAILMGVFSGILGVIVAFVLAPIIEILISKYLNLDLPGIVSIPISRIPFTNLSFPFATLISIILFSALITFIAGYLPSKKATKMHVIDALRDE
ncbi:MAG: ATP-binding cassette domain-containing protein [Clostridia bacterium]|nr:ATP-binding cassette domain-containing protein [Clostridia bacterium]